MVKAAQSRTLPSARRSVHTSLGARAPPEDVKAVGFDILRHRISLTYEAEAEELTPEKIIQRIFDRVEVP